MRDFVIAMALIFCAGAANGLHETLMYHWGDFARVFPGAAAEWWNPAESWRNKYAAGEAAQGPAFFLSTTVLVFVTDAKHALNALADWTNLMGLYVLFFAWHRTRKYRWHFLMFVLVFASWYVCRAIGFHLVYTVFF